MNRRAFGERVTAMQGSLYRVAASYLRGESDRLDAVAEAIAKAWEKRQTLRDEALFATWMTRILIRVCVDIQRRQKRLIPTDDVAERTAEDEKVTALREAIEKAIETKDKNLKGTMATQGTTPRRLTDLIGSLCDLTSGSGDKGTPVVWIQGYFTNYAE